VAVDQLFPETSQKGKPLLLKARSTLGSLERTLLVARQAARDAETQLTQMQDLIRVSALLTSSRTVDDVLQEVMDTVIQLGDMKRAYLMLGSPDQADLKVKIARNWDRQTISDEDSRFSRGVIAMAIAHRQPIVTMNARHDERFSAMQSVIDYELTAILCVPLLRHDQIIGVLYADSDTLPASFNVDSLPLIAAFANQVAIALENAQLFEQVTADLEAMQREMQRIKIQEATFASDNVLQNIVQTVAQVFDLAYTAIRLKRGERLIIAATYGSTIQPITTIPLFYQGETVGHLLAALPGTNPAPFQIPEALTRQIGIAVYAVRVGLDLKRALEQIVTAREEERRRLRRDLHDGLGPTLAGIMFKLDAAHNYLQHSPAHADHLLTELKEQVQTMIQDIRLLVYNLRPPALDDLGLVTALRDQIAQYDRANGLQIAFESPATLPPLPAAVEVAVYRVALEAITNVIRHAQARTCRLRLTVGTAITLEVSDDGIGLPEHYRAGLGLTSMQERITELGGEFSVTRSATGGTHLLARIQLSLGTNS